MTERDLEDEADVAWSDDALELEEDEDGESSEDGAAAEAAHEEDEAAPGRRVRLVRKVKPRKKRKVMLRRRREDELPVDEHGAHVVFDESYESALDDEDDGDGGEGLGRLARMLAVEFVPTVARKIMQAGGQALTEDLVRRAIEETPLPREVGGFLAGQAESVRKEFYRIVAREVGTFLKTINLSKELQKLLTSLSFEIKTEIRFIPNDQAVRDADETAPVKPDVKSRVRVKRHRDETAEAGEEPGRKGRLFRWRDRHPAAEPAKDEPDDH